MLCRFTAVASSGHGSRRGMERLRQARSSSIGWDLERHGQLQEIEPHQPGLWPRLQDGWRRVNIPPIRGAQRVLRPTESGDLWPCNGADVTADPVCKAVDRHPVVSEDAMDLARLTRLSFFQGIPE